MTFDELKEKAHALPLKPGVYIMQDAKNTVIYVGKAKALKNRVSQYFQDSASHTEKTRAMVSQIDHFDVIVADSEFEALVLENSLIKRHQPHYNILLKDDKTFPHLVIDVESEFPSLRKYRGKRNDKSKYFGPFASVLAVNNVLDTVQKAFLLRSCRDNVFKNRERPCLMYQIKRCSAPCVGRISKEDYHKLVREAVDFLDGKNTKIQAELSEKMQEASDRQDYEQALVFRDRIRALTNVQTGTMVEYATISSCDIVAIARKNDVVCIQVFFIRSGQNCGNVPYFPKQTQGAEDGEILEAFLGSFYSEHIPPKEVIVSQPLENGEFLEEALGTHINTYQKGAKAKLLSNVLDNAYASIDRKMAMEASVKSNLEEMQRVFNLPRLPQRIEIYDNSHIQGSYAIGAMVVATPEGFDKKSYRTFNIKNSEITNDDFAMMKEVLTRRFNRMAPENRPDVILLDGGLGQLHAVHEALKDFDLTGISIIAISKGPERNAGKEFYHQLGKESFALPFQSPIAFYLQNLRDESHRFAIGTHRKKRAKSITKSRLDEVEGIGAKRKRDLLNYFGSVEEISQAGIKDIEKVGGISKKTAEKIYNYFHK